MAHTEETKALLLQNLKKTPIITVVCDKMGIGRASYYRWREDKEFAKACDNAIQEGSQVVNDLAEAQLLTAIKNGNLGAIIFWLRNRHSAYRTRVELSATSNFELSEEQEKKINQALLMSGLVEGVKDEDK
ncbi:MAG: phBC6A51 family helix-turn-helix protein [bacterium]